VGALQRCNTLQRTATRCNALQHTATHCHCNTLIKVSATHCNITPQEKIEDVVHETEVARAREWEHCSALQHIAPHCNTLQHTVAHCNTLIKVTATHCTSTLQQKIEDVVREMEVARVRERKRLEAKITLLEGAREYDVKVCCSVCCSVCCDVCCSCIVVCRSALQCAGE